MSDVRGRPGGLLTMREYQQARSGWWGSEWSFEWWRRKHGAKLIEGGALVVINHRPFIDPPRADAVVVEVGRAVARARRASTPTDHTPTDAAL